MNLWSLLGDILFVGTGLFGGDVPQMVESAHRMNAVQAAVDAQRTDDGTLEFQWTRSAVGLGVDARDALRSGRYDRVVLTENPAADGFPNGAETVDYATRFVDLALEANAHARILVYETWPVLQPGQMDEWRGQIQTALPQWQALVDGLNQHAAGAESLPVRLVPLAQGFLALSDEIAAGHVEGLSSIEQLFDTERRLNERGSYFAAMMLQAALSDTNPSGLPIWLGRTRPRNLDEALTPAMAVVMQRIAWQTLRGYDPQRVRDMIAKPVEPPAANEARPESQGNLQGFMREGMSVNLSGVSDWSSEIPFIDVFKAARTWTGHVRYQWGGMDENELRAGGFLDENGWILRLPGNVTSISTLLLTDLPAQANSAAGRYDLRYRGKGRIDVGGGATRVEREPGLISFDFRPGPETAVEVIIRGVDPADPIRDITVIRQDRRDLAAEGKVFNPDFLARLKGVEGIRFMDWMRTNDSTLASLDDRPRLEDHVWTREVGAPVEVMIALANELDADPWFTIPHLADDALVREYARLVRAGLEPGLRASVELSNEVWNPQFTQAHWADAGAKDLWNHDWARVQYGAYRAMQVADIWAEEFGDEADQRLVRVIATQSGWKGIEEDLLNAPVWQENDPDTYRPPHEAFDAYAITGYFGGIVADEARAELVKQWITEGLEAAARDADARDLSGETRESYIRAHRHDLAISNALADLRDGSVSGVTEGSLQSLIEDDFAYHREVADRYGLDLVMYEGGSHIVAGASEYNNNEMTEFLIALNYAPGIADLYRELIEGWQAVTDQPFNHFMAIYSPTRYGSWGLLRYLDDDNPRWRFVSGNEE